MNAFIVSCYRPIYLFPLHLTYLLQMYPLPPSMARRFELPWIIFYALAIRQSYILTSPFLTRLWHAIDCEEEDTPANNYISFITRYPFSFTIFMADARSKFKGSKSSEDFSVEDLRNANQPRRWPKSLTQLRSAPRFESFHQT
jgi:hypothetical protein